MHDNPFQSPGSVEFQPPNPAWGVPWLKIVLGLGLCALIFALIVPATRGTRQGAYRSSCRNKIFKIPKALDAYYEDHGSYPPAYTVDANGKPLHSWRTLLLPYLGEEELYKSIDLTKPWDDPVNAIALNTVVEIYQCPSLSFEELHRTTYLTIVSPQSCLRAGTPTTKQEITDGLNKTVVVIEVPENFAVPWMAPQDVDEATFVDTLREQMPEPKPENMLRWSHMGAISHLAYADGHIEEIRPEEKSAAERRALITIAGWD